MLRTWVHVAAWVMGVLMMVIPAGAAAEDLTELSATEAAARIRAGTLKSETLVRALVDVVERKRDLGAFITFDRERALAAARKADGLAARGSFAGPLHGVPIVVKDNIHIAGLPNSAGTPALKGFVPTANAPVAEKLLRAGAIVLGKTNMHELAFGITSNNAAFGPVRNAYDPSRIAGGSSGGTGAAIAARMAPAGLGSDTGGSVRIPAALNGIAGLRPTRTPATPRVRWLVRWPTWCCSTPSSPGRATGWPPRHSGACASACTARISGGAWTPRPSR
jgi:indoleacetamide hydrolase